MAKIESRIGVVQKDATTIYNFIADFTNFNNFVPGDQVQDFESTTDTCNFSVPGIGKAGLEIIERDPVKLIKIKSDDKMPIKLVLWIQIKEAAENDCRVKVTVDPDVNMMMAQMVKGPLKKFVDQLVDQIEKFNFQ